MLKKEITYTDYNGDTRTESFYFHISKTELNDMDIDAGGTLASKLTAMVENRDAIGMAKFFRELIIRSYGEKSADGRFFDKGEDYALGKRFTRSAAFDSFYMDLFGDETGEKITAFVYGIIPPDIAAQARANTTPNVVVGEIGTEG